jgi:hypothetical protein
MRWTTEDPESGQREEIRLIRNFRTDAGAHRASQRMGTTGTLAWLQSDLHPIEV